MPQGQAEQILGESFAQLAYDAYGLVQHWTTPDGHTIPRWAETPAQVQTAWGAAVGAVLSLDLTLRGQGVLVMVLHKGEQILGAIQDLQMLMTDVSGLLGSATAEVQSASAEIKSAADAMVRLEAALGNVTDLAQIEQLTTQLAGMHQSFVDTTASLDATKTALDDTKAKLDAELPTPAPTPTPTPEPTPPSV